MPPKDLVMMVASLILGFREQFGARGATPIEVLPRALKWRTIKTLGTLGWQCIILPDSKRRNGHKQGWEDPQSGQVFSQEGAILKQAAYFFIAKNKVDQWN